jgi:hypothetical protein
MRTKQRYSVVTTRQYVDKDGEIKDRWITIGSGTEIKGGIVCTLDTVPLPSQNWDGTFYIFLNENAQRGRRVAAVKQEIQNEQS